jgi:hypothetical protein
MNLRILFLVLLLCGMAPCARAAFPVSGGNAGTSIGRTAHYMASPTQDQEHENHGNSKPKYQGIAALLAYFFGPYGLHDFYMGDRNKGNTHLALLLLPLLCVAIVALGTTGLVVVTPAATTLLTVAGIALYAANALWAYIELFEIIFGVLKPVSGHWG